MTEFNVPQATGSSCTAKALARIPSAIGCFMIAGRHGRKSGSAKASDCPKSE
jgi:hypothetical protein